jgi:hypothetical protein
MTRARVEIVRERLRNQRLLAPLSSSPEEVVSSFGAVQSQDYPGAKWAIGLRARGTTDRDVESAFNDGRILRTHILRPTWHFVAVTDLRWLMALSGPRVAAATAGWFRQHGLDESILTRSRKTIAAALKDRRYLTRGELSEALHKSGISVSGSPLAAVVVHAEITGVICSGPRREKQFTYALFDERVPQNRAVLREDALGELAWRYFSSHGPASIRDYVWWSGLTTREASAGIEMNRSRFASFSYNGHAYWSAARQRRRSTRAQPAALLLPNYDEYVIAYKDRSAIMDRARSARIAVQEEFAHGLFIDGRLTGNWRRRTAAAGVSIALRPHRRLTRAEMDAVAAEAERYGKFAGVAVSLTFV